MNSLEAGQLAAQILAIGAAVDAAEALVRRVDYVTGGIYDWTLVRTSRAWSTRGHVAHLLDLLFRPRMYEGLMAGQIFLAAGLLVISSGKEFQGTIAAFLFGLFLLRVLTHIRHSYGLDGSDQMSIILLATLALAFTSPTQFGSTAAIYFIAFQSFLAYISSGVAKMTASIWRSGKALPAILNTQSYGSRYASGALRGRPRTALLACWAVMIFQG
jgi:hypothetical protein